MLAAGAAALSVLGAAQAGHAAIVDWALLNGTFDDGGTFGGMFSWDTSSNEITDWNVFTTDGTTRSGETYQTTPLFFLGGAFANGSGGPSFYNGFFTGQEFDLTNIPLSTPDIITGLTGSEYDYNVNFPVGPFETSNVRTVTGGDAVGFFGAAPEPAAWALMIGGFATAGAMLRRRRALALA
jgi:hypothetical protein